MKLLSFNVKKQIQNYIPKLKIVNNKIGNNGCKELYDYSTADF